MNTVKHAESPEEHQSGVRQIDDDAVAIYLESHPDFFERQGKLLARLQLQHSTGGAAVSLIERQVSVLRQRNDSLENQLHQLVEVARGNDDLADKIHALALLLIGTSRRSEVVALLEEQLRMKFHADRSVLVLIGSVDEVGGVTGNFLRLADRDDSALGPFRSFLESDSVRCGPVRDAQRDYLFGSDDCEIGSLALIPLGKQSAQGFLAIGSRSAEHFNPGVSIDFLSRLGELVAAALAR